MGQWSELPSDLLNAIDAQFVYADKVRVHAVCESWYSRLPKMPNHKLQQLPWLLQAVNNKETSHELFNLREEKFYPIDLPEVIGRFYKGSSNGWVVMGAGEGSIYAKSPDIYVIDPLRRVQIQLPPRNTFPDVEGYCADRSGEEYSLLTEGGIYFFDANHVHLNLLEKVITSSIPSSDDCVAVAIYGELGTVAWCTRNHEKWTPLHLDVNGPFEDLIFIKNVLYVVSCQGYLLQVENIGENPKVTIVAPLLAKHMYAGLGIPHRMFLVECSDGSLNMVGRFMYDNVTFGFKVYKLDLTNSTWLAVDNIGGDIFFLGMNYSLSISSSDLPRYEGNRIYFTDDSWVFLYERERNIRGDSNRVDSDIGVFNLDDGSIERLPCIPRSLWPPPIWVKAPRYH
ncbi:hypothetical protein LguiA_025230 [Lonicera macranthoides]